MWPVFFHNRVVAPCLDERRVHLYLDVSGSTEHVQPLIYGLVQQLADRIGEPFHLFSNKVEPINLREVKEGLRRTTRGMDFDCIVEHAIRSRHRKVLVVTDGYADLSEENQTRLRRGEVKVYLVLTERNEACPLKPLAKETWQLKME